MHHTYYISTIPGHHLPHTWLQRDDEVVAIRDLLDAEVLTLFVGIDHSTEIKDSRIHVVLVGKGGWCDRSGQWIKYRGVNECGGVLVRPDGIVAWRGDLPGKDQQYWQHLVDRILKVAS